jgi:alpha-galactosidase
MAGALGVGGNLLAWTDAELATARAHVERYKQIRPIVVAGDLYRLASPHEGPVSALMYVSKDKGEAVLFAFRLLPTRIVRQSRIRLAGLEPDGIYAVEGQPEPLSGRAWAERGIALSLGDLSSALLHIRRL